MPYDIRPLISDPTKTKYVLYPDRALIKEHGIRDMQFIFQQPKVGAIILIKISKSPKQNPIAILANGEPVFPVNICIIRRNIYGNTLG